tara:strand:+ start:3054 stop:4208 length:1155 start_codon:yes stop_codon:yes gene_type:complete
MKSLKLKKAIIYTEEYSKFTTGMVKVCLEHFTSHPDARFYTNADHWIGTNINDTNKIGTQGLGYYLFGNEIKSIKYRLIIKIFRKILNQISFPLDMVFTIVHLFRFNKNIVWYIHIGGWPAGVRARLLIIYLKCLNFKYINLIIHNEPLIIKKYGLNNIWAKVTNISCDNIVTVSNTCAVKLRFYFPNIKVIYNGISDKYKSKDISISNFTNYKKKILIISSLHALKETGKCIKELISMSNLFEINWAGPIDYRYLSKFCNPESVKKHINFLGYVEDPNILIRESDIIFIPSRAFESFSMVFLEASMNSKPTICYDTVATAELVLDGKSGWIIDTNKKSLEKLLFKISSLSDKIIKNHGLKARKEYINLYTSRIMTIKYDELNK